MTTEKNTSLSPIANGPLSIDVLAKILKYFNISTFQFSLEIQRNQ